ncbi:GNAT family N-acetyltransferase [Neorhizobium alkalisoli]|uniref:Acetyltransferase (GNAT) family protein n=1 Tax=Neorhizobium alkalisoli TaxID=528178 RepID=A0A561QRX9_9HYPH|nr:GNAT family N-acetyltransferase [Neorhizobium alkalisoli]TWF53155.1 acetyltransferase (GNAT) family protein [Neorhizobium alkalisoli]
MDDSANLNRPPLRRSLADTSLEDAARALTEGFAGYVVTFTASAASIALRMERENIDADCSEVFFDGDTPAGILLVARRGNRCRISALGIGPAIRGKGVGRQVMAKAIDAARRRGDREMVLEVIDSNPRARDLYVSLGFETSRQLVGFSRGRRRPAPDLPTDAPELAACDPVKAADMLLRFAEPGLTWQTDPVCFRHAAPPLKGFAIGETAVALLDDSSAEIRIHGLAVDPGQRRKGLGRALADGLASAYPGRRLYIVENVPKGLLDPFMRKIGWRRSSLTQSEMRLKL